MLAFPSNQFGSQEPGSNEEIQTFACSRYKATFPLFSKVSVWVSFHSQSRSSKRLQVRSRCKTTFLMFSTVAECVGVLSSPRSSKCSHACWRYKATFPMFPKVPARALFSSDAASPPVAAGTCQEVWPEQRILPVFAVQAAL